MSIRSFARVSTTADTFRSRCPGGFLRARQFTGTQPDPPCYFAWRFREALKSERLQEVIDQHDGMIDIFILCVDRDGVPGRPAGLDQIGDEFGNGRIFFAENAWEELETWILAGLHLPAGWSREDIRAEVHVKEDISSPLRSSAAWATVSGVGAWRSAVRPRGE